MSDWLTSDVLEFDWVWDASCRSTATLLSCDNRKVNFHSEYSCGTAAIRGSKELAEGQHFWEIKMTSPVYGTDMVNLYILPPNIDLLLLCKLNLKKSNHRWIVKWVEVQVNLSLNFFLSVQMVGIGTSDVNLDKYRHTFCSLLGKDADSWGLSYTGKINTTCYDVAVTSQSGCCTSYSSVVVFVCQACCIMKETRWTFPLGLDRAPSLESIWTRGTAHSLSSKIASV